jgi:hypothetical protein
MKKKEKKICIINKIIKQNFPSPTLGILEDVSEAAKIILQINNIISNKELNSS